MEGAPVRGPAREIRCQAQRETQLRLCTSGMQSRLARAPEPQSSTWMQAGPAPSEWICDEKYGIY
jgi:hypothetical protein